MSAAHRSMMVMLNNTDLLWYAGLAAAACVGVVIGVLITVAIVLCDRKCFRKRKDGAKVS
jgi:hypothetical protein